MPTPTVYDCIIIGGGMAGAAAAEALSRRGQRVLLLEQFAPGHTRGSSHGDGRIIRYAYAEPTYVALARLAYPLWHDLGARAGEPLIHLTGGWDCDRAGSRELAAMAANFRRYDIPFERLTGAESNRRYPHFRVSADFEVITHPDGGVAFADRTVAALWRLAAAQGVTFVTDERAVALAATPDRVRVTGSSGTVYEAGALILAAGSYTRPLAAQLGLDVPVGALQVQVAHFPVRGGPSHRVGAMPYFIDYSYPNPFYGLPEIVVSGVKVGWHTRGTLLDDVYGELPVDGEQLRGMQAYVGERLPHLSAEPSRIITCRYGTTPDENFIIDRHPDLPNVVIGAGFHGHGFKFTPIIGALLADLAGGDTPPLALDLFRLGRFAAHAQEDARL